jgi:hypothetical protein
MPQKENIPWMETSIRTAGIVFRKMWSEVDSGEICMFASGGGGIVVYAYGITILMGVWL